MDDVLVEGTPPRPSVGAEAKGLRDSGATLDGDTQIQEEVVVAATPVPDRHQPSFGDDEFVVQETPTR